MVKRLLVWNPGSGGAKANSDLPSKFDVSTTQVMAMSRTTDLAKVMIEAAHNGVETVVAAGGDGTVNAIVNALMRVEPEMRPSLAIVPLGTANDFAGTLAIPDSVDDAIELLNSSRPIPMDVVKIQAQHFERYFANVAAGGNSVRVTEEMTDEMKTRWGAFCYLRGAVEVLTDLKSFRVSAVCDGEKFSDLDCWAILVANGKTNAGRVMVAPAASPCDGLLDVIIVRDGTALDILEIIANAVLGSYLDCEQVIFRKVKSLALHSEPPMRFTLDGEVIDREPVRFDVVENAINMYVGRDFSGSE
jgi:diacylglycerol kinase (ATP)